MPQPHSCTQDMSAEQFIVAWVQSELLLPDRLLYKGENLYYDVMEESIR